jgi:hypothetical protein
MTHDESTTPARLRKTRRVRRALAAVVVAAAVAAAPLTNASSAKASVWDPHVTLWGYAACHPAPLAWEVAAQDVWFYVEATGEREEATVNKWSEFFSVTLNTIPSGGSWVQVFEYCNMPGSTPGWRLVRDQWVSRPWVTDFSGPYIFDA